MPAQIPEAQWRIRLFDIAVAIIINLEIDDFVQCQAKLDGDLAFKNGEFDKVLRFRFANILQDLKFKPWQAVSFYTTALEQNAANGTNPKHTLLSNRSAAFCALKKYEKALEDALSCISCSPSFAKVGMTCLTSAILSRFRT